jgi:hypothetical protein
MDGAKRHATAPDELLGSTRIFSKVQLADLRICSSDIDSDGDHFLAWRPHGRLRASR